MKPFIFRAEAALTVRRRQEDDAVRTLQLAERRERDARDALEQARAALAATLDRGADVAGQPGDVTLRVWYRNWIVAQRGRVAACDTVVATRQRETQTAAAAAVAAQRKRKALERARERAHARWRRAEEHEMQIAIDELAVGRYARASDDEGEDR